MNDAHKMLLERMDCGITVREKQTERKNSIMKTVIKNRYTQEVIVETEVSFAQTVTANKSNLSNADLHGVDLSNADLSDANLRGADLSRANLHEAKITESQKEKIITSLSLEIIKN